MFWRRFTGNWSEKEETPRRQTLFYSQGNPGEGLFAVLRMTWYDGFDLMGVSEKKIYEVDATPYDDFFRHVDDSLRRGADISIICNMDAAELGIKGP